MIGKKLSRRQRQRLNRRLDERGIRKALIHEQMCIMGGADCVKPQKPTLH